MVRIAGLCFAVSWWGPWPQVLWGAVGAPVASEGELSCNRGNERQEREMQRCRELCRANGKEDKGGKKRNEGDVREAGGEADVACAEGTASAAGKAHTM